MGIESVVGWGTKEQKKTACHRSERHDWKPCQVGAGMLCQINGKKDFAASRNSWAERGTPMFLEIT
jgi:hypothetical protein